MPARPFTAVSSTRSSSGCGSLTVEAGDTPRPVRPCGGHSSCSASIGSSPAARRAGSHEATATSAMNNSTAVVNVAGSVGWTPTSIPAIARVSTNAARRPVATPTALRRSPCPRTSLKMRAGGAPRAILMPIPEDVPRGRRDPNAFLCHAPASTSLVHGTGRGRSPERVRSSLRLLLECVRDVYRLGSRR